MYPSLVVASALRLHRRTNRDASWICSCGLSGFNYAFPSDVDYETHAAQVVTSALEKTQPEHIIELSPDRWIMQHSMACRLSGQLFDCPVNQAAVNSQDDLNPDFIGRFICTHDVNGNLIIGKEVE